MNVVAEVGIHPSTVRVVEQRPGLAGHELVVDGLGREVHEGEVVRALGGLDVLLGHRVDVALHVAREGLLVERPRRVVGGLDHPLEVVERELRVDGDQLLHLDHGVDSLAALEAVLDLVGGRRQPVAQEVLEQQLAEPSACLRRAQDVLEPRDLLRLLEHLRRRPVELREPLDEVLRRLARRLLRREQAPVDPLQPPVDALVELPEPAVEPVLDAAEALVHERAAVARERDDERGERCRGEDRYEECG